MGTQGIHTSRSGRWQFRLSSLLMAMAAGALALSITFAVLPQYVDGCKLVSGQLLIHLTPAAQELLFDPPAPMGPMHETKVIVLSSLAYDLASLVTVVGLFTWIGSRLRRAWKRSIHELGKGPQSTEVSSGPALLVHRADQGRVSSTSRMQASLAGGMTGAIVGGLGCALLLRSMHLVPQTMVLGGVVGLMSGAALARRGLERACVAASMLTMLIVSLAVIAWLN